MTGTTIPYDNMSTVSNPTPPTPFFTKCCFCIPIRMGCFILGYLSLLINVVHSILYLALTTYLSVSTHGFDHFDGPSNLDERQLAELDEMEKPILQRIELVMVIVLLANFIWLFINIACLVGLHKRRPGPVRMFVAFASVKLILSLAAYIFLMTTNNSSTQTTIAESFDFALAAYFILVYYVYSLQLEREEMQRIQHIPEAVNNLAFIYPSKLDKKTLVA
ncbi:uncharacterized protein ACR2FA_010406 [Aphomia sociella]